jgi:hypothetical protein
MSLATHHFSIRQGTINHEGTIDDEHYIFTPFTPDTLACRRRTGARNRRDRSDYDVYRQ